MIFGFIVSVYFLLGLSWLQCILCALPHQCFARQNPRIITGGDGSRLLQFQKTNLERRTRHFFLVDHGIQLSDSFTFGSGCNLTLLGYKLDAIGNCIITVHISPNQHTNKLISGYSSTYCSKSNVCLIDWQAYTRQQLHLSGKRLTIRLTTTRGSTCTVSSRLRRGSYVWDGVRLIAQGMVYRCSLMLRLIIQHFVNDFCSDCLYPYFVRISRTE